MAAPLLCAGLGAAVLSCSTEESELDSLWKTGEQVHTQIAVALPGKAKTRMGDEVVQKNGVFLGLKDVTLIPFYKSGTAVEPIAQSDNRIGAPISLEAIEKDGLNDQNNSKIYYDIRVPVGTNAFLIYARSMGSGTGDAVNGRINASGLDADQPAMQPSGISFRLQPIRPDKSITGTKGEQIINALNTIFTGEWSKTENSMLYGLYPMVQDMRAGSSASVLAFLNEIYEGLKNATATDYVKTVIDNIKAMVEVDEDGNIVLDADGSLKALKADYAGWPSEESGLPAGAAVIAWNESTKQFDPVTDKNNLGAMNVDITNYAYPAELWYRTNSRIDTDQESRAEYYPSAADWNSVLSHYFTAEQAMGGTVESTTRSIAIRRQLEYAVARLDLKVAAEGKTLEDASEGMPQQIDPATLKITGVLVGQQGPVDYQFEPLWASTDDDTNDLTIYDSQVDAKIGGDYAHTLVLQTPDSRPVNIAVEMENQSGMDIVTEEYVEGSAETKKQVIPQGCRFYLIGRLDPTDTAHRTTASPWDDTWKMVFRQDFTTQVTFTVKDLKHAYYFIPPMSSSQLDISLGVVDWKLSSPVSVELDKE